jgi:hypothetical protein
MVTDAQGKSLVGYMAHHLDNIPDRPVKTSDPLPDYFAYPKHAIVDAALKNEANTLLDNSNEGEQFRFYLEVVLAYGVPDTMRQAFENAFFGDNTNASKLRQDYPNIANAYSPEQWQQVFQGSLGFAKDFGALWAD